MTKIPGIDFTDITDAAKAYFDCANDNGGINGRPVDYIVEEHGTDPQQVGSLATKLIESDKVTSFVGNTSILDCPVNHELYEKNNYYAIVAGVPNECFSTPNIAALNMGPLYSSLGAVRYVIDKAGAKGTLVIVSPKQPGNEAVNQGALSYAKQQGLKTVSRLENVPISDPASLAQAIVSQAGDGGGVVLDFTPPEGVKIMQAVAQQGLIDKVKWGSSTPLNDTSVPDAVGPDWEGKMFINAELALLDSNGPDMQLYRAVNKKYSPDNPVGSFGQMGFVAAKMFVDTMLKVAGGQAQQGGHQRRPPEHQELQDGHPLQALVLPEDEAARPEQHRSHGHAQGQQDDRDRGMHGHPGLLPGPEVRPRVRGAERREQVAGESTSSIRWGPPAAPASAGAAGQRFS